MSNWEIGLAVVIIFDLITLLMGWKLIRKWYENHKQAAATAPSRTRRHS
jgi:uncharacterized membrane protein YozB (DUF420 family)